MQPEGNDLKFIHVLCLSVAQLKVDLWTMYFKFLLFEINVKVT
jgi:hypothetical protein